MPLNLLKKTLTSLTIHSTLAAVVRPTQQWTYSTRLMEKLLLHYRLTIHPRRSSATDTTMDLFDTPDGKNAATLSTNDIVFFLLYPSHHAFFFLFYFFFLFSLHQPRFVATNYSRKCMIFYFFIFFFVPTMRGWCSENKKKTNKIDQLTCFLDLYLTPCFTNSCIFFMLN